jgi:Conserved TM helix
MRANSRARPPSAGDAATQGRERCGPEPVEISNSLQKGLDDLIGFLPRLLGFLIILLIGYIIAKVLQKVVTVALEKVGTDRAVRSGAGGECITRVAPDTSPSHLIGRVVFWFVMLGVLSIAISSLGIAALNDFLADVFAYLPNVVAAILILVIAIALAGALTRLVTSALGETGAGKLMATAVPALVLAIAVFMVLNQLKIATAIVTITYAALLGALALGSALAFGLGGRDVASRMLEDAYRRGQLERERYRAQQGRPRGDGVTASTAPQAAGPGRSERLR